MYDDILNNIAYSISVGGLDSLLLNSIFSYCNAYSLSFFSFLGVCVGVKFLKDAFN